ncbi:phosphate transporter (Pho88) [Pyrenophora tritici-repentis Pt-1C-BFP]|uniref:Phosphate transporter (Pho88) n=1 Tax=Pyrenophora tritici-repentis (strain Pt-1C-BFP) TaxID=426418 RepID=B2VVP6_PYRTR|nr:phosphate transporter (Pho88) [Pyrenophora tritici-repentis Pt-1C-BFP]EDU40696.1 phosphate transporter (Pho88) [Pyrenophora tritici-repentis Pt-1C-BFP]
MAISPQITNLVIILGFMQISKKIPFDDPNVLNGVRALYIVSNIIIASVYFYVQAQINKKNDMTVVKYVEPAPMGSGEEPKFVATTVKAYDLQKLRELFKAQLMGVGMIMKHWCMMVLWVVARSDDKKSIELPSVLPCGVKDE